MKKILLVLFSIGFVACTFESSITDDTRNKIATCTDTRDGEQFSFNTNDITNVRYGIGAAHSLTVVDFTGKTRYLTGDMESYIKCKTEDIKCKTEDIK